MELCLQLPKIIGKYNLHKDASQTVLAEYLGVHRQTVAKLLSGEARSLNLDVLSKLCYWLINKGVSRSDLPAELLGVVPAGLWQTVAKMRISLYMGQYCEVDKDKDAPVRLWLSRRDADVANAITKEVYEAREEVHDQNRKPEYSSLNFDYARFRYRINSQGVRQRYLSEDGPAARRMFKKIRSQERDVASIFLGSAEVNYLVELYMADLFNLQPFEPSEGGRCAPVYMLFRHPHSAMRSCFGGLDVPSGYKGEPIPGLYFLGKNGQWSVCGYDPKKTDAALTVIVSNAAANTLDIVMFGFTGRATTAMATDVIKNTHQLWPPYYETTGKRIGIYISRILVDEETDPNAESYIVKDVKHERLDPSLIKKHVKL